MIHWIQLVFGQTLTDKALDGPTFLFLGYKGSGKSAIAERIALISEEKFDRFVTILNLADFPFTPFSKIIHGDVEPEAKFPDAWSWLLLIYLVDSLRGDESIRHGDPVAFQSAVNILAATGILPNPDLKQLVRESAKRSFKLTLPKVFEEKTESEKAITALSDVPNFVNHLKKLISTVRSNGHHYLVIDGLDDILTQRDVQYRSLGALIFEVARLNSSFNKLGVPAKIIVLCRTDLFVRISGANKNKIRQDLSIELDWYHDTHDPTELSLVHIARLRGALVPGGPPDVFTKFFPAEVDGVPVHRFLLEYTRHTPRDFLQLLKNIQDFYKGGVLQRSQILNGVRQYSISYFHPEIVDELNGYFDEKDITKIFECITQIQKRDFFVSELLQRARELDLSEETARDMLSHLFDCSAVGNVQNRPTGTTFYTFKFRNRHSTFKLDSRVILHKGMWKALNLV